ncbi:MAG TPA: DUF2268 domain-containing putative Zn-dependent protease [Bacteroidales bacterium]
MKRVSTVRLRILLLFILFTCVGNAGHCQNSKQDATSPNIIELTKGCRLVLNANINPADSVSIEIVKGIQNILPRVQQLIPADSVLIELAISNENILPVWGIGSRTTSGYTNGHRVETVEMYYDPNHVNFKVELILHGLTHELHHACRVRMPNFQLTLLECMVNEGLADHFMTELFHCGITPWGSALTEEQILQNMIRVKPLLRVKFQSWTTEFDENYFKKWMFGRPETEQIPGWTGYSIGWKIVENYLKAHPEAKASSLVFTSPEIIVSETPELIADNK